MNSFCLNTEQLDMSELTAPFVTMKDTMPEKPISPAVLPMVHPLDEFYALTGKTLPPIEVLDGKLLPEPERTLLAHLNDMTPTLEKFHQCDLFLKVLSRAHRGDFYYREVLLVKEKTNEPVEFGAIKINLALFAPSVRRQILEERIPLGHLMEEHGVTHTCRPKAFLRIFSDELINNSFGLKEPQMVYGRRNTLLDPVHRPLAEIVEILPPATQ